MTEKVQSLRILSFELGISGGQLGPLTDRPQEGSALEKDLAVRGPWQVVQPCLDQLSKLLVDNSGHLRFMQKS